MQVVKVNQPRCTGQLCVQPHSYPGHIESTVLVRLCVLLCGAASEPGLCSRVEHHRSLSDALFLSLVQHRCQKGAMSPDTSDQPYSHQVRRVIAERSSLDSPQQQHLLSPCSIQSAGSFSITYDSLGKTSAPLRQRFTDEVTRYALSNLSLWHGACQIDAAAAVL